MSHFQRRKSVLPLNPFASSTTRPEARSQAFKRRLGLESLEDRLLFAIALRPGPVVDEVVVSPTGNGGAFDVRFGPATLRERIGGQLDHAIVDLSRPTSDDQRYAVPTASEGPLFRVDTSERYTIAAVGSPRIGAAPAAEFLQREIGYQLFDVDRLAIETLHVAKFPFAVDTTLVDELSTGDTSFLIADASGWSYEPTESAETRSLAWYGYTDSTGFTYPDYTYTRNTAHDFENGLWSPGRIWFDASVGAYRVALNAPWNGPTIAAGTAVRNAMSGPAWNEPFPMSLINSSVRWPQLSATIGGEWINGAPNDFAFRPGTAYVQVVSPLGPSIWNDVAFGPEEDFPGAVLTTVSAIGANPIVLELDVMAKQVSSFTGDFNRDGAVNLADYVLWRRGAGSTGVVAFSGADGNGDGAVNHLDYQIWRRNFGANVLITIDSATAEHGQASIISSPVGPVIRYQSEPWFVGTDIVEYTIRNMATLEMHSSRIVIDVHGSDYAQNATVAATLAAQSQVAGNLAPTILSDPIYTLAAGQTLSEGRLLEPFSDGSDQLVVRLLSGPAHGSLNMSYDASFEYTPVDGFAGIDSFRYEAFDGRNTTAAVASLEVLSAGELLDSRLYHVAIAMLNYDAVHRRLPITNNSDYFDANGNPFLSWRVHVLPFFGFQELYDRFRLDEPWNSANNLPLLNAMPDFYRSPGDAAGGTATRIQTFTGPDAPFGNRPIGSDQTGARLIEFQDDLQHTILVAQSGADAAVPWTKPDDMEFNPSNPLAALGNISGQIHAMTADAVPLTLPATISPDTFKALVTINGDEVVDAHTLRREYYQANPGTRPPQLFGRSREDTYFAQLGIAAHNHHDSRARFPVAGAGNFDDEGNPYLSWRVHILPFLGYKNLYERFILTEPWNSPNNLALLAEMPDVFRSAGDAADTTTTRVQTFTGRDAPFGYRTPGADQLGPRAVDIADGFSNTILFVEAAADQAIPWTQPDDLEFDKDNPLNGIDLSENIRTVLFDIGLATLRPDIPAAAFSALVTRAGREAIFASSFKVTDSGPFKPPLQRQNDLKQIITAMLDHVSQRTRFPVDHFSTEGTPLLSWRVMLLPFLEQGNLYNQFRLNEPWDSPHNLSLLRSMPDVYRSIGDPSDSVTTRVMHFNGPNAPFPSANSASQLGPRQQDITDGSSSTIAFVEAGAENAVPWTKPGDLPLHANNPSSAIGQLGEAILAAFFDGHIETLSALLSPGDLKARITHQSGENTNVPNPIVINPGVFVIQSGGDTKTNEFGADNFFVVLDREPAGQVVVDLNTSDNAVAVLDRAQLTFTTETWNIPQQVAFRGVDNQVVNADRTVHVTVSVNDALSDADYDAVPTQVFAATVFDDEPKPPAPPGDYNRNGSVDAADLVVWRKGSSIEHHQPNSGADGNGNGRVDQNDYQLWRINFGASLPVLATSASLLPAQSAPASDETAQSAKNSLKVDAGSRDQYFNRLAFDFNLSAANESPLSRRQPVFVRPVAAFDSEPMLLLAAATIQNENWAEATSHDALDTAFSGKLDLYERNEPLLSPCSTTDESL
jgi:hypothetical protein